MSCDLAFALTVRDKNERAAQRIDCAVASSSEGEIGSRPDEE
jgi:hypothetical protein